MRDESGRSRGPDGHRSLLLLLLSLAAPLPAGARDLSFDELKGSADPVVLIEWGKRYFYGVQVPQSIDRAIELFCGAAAQGSGEAQYRLGEIYSRALAGKRDEVLGAAWLSKAALSSYKAAKARLAQWDLAGADLPAEPECVQSARMTVRTLPRARPSAPAQPEPAPGSGSDPAPQPASAPHAGPQSLASARGPGLRRAEIRQLVQDLAPGFGLDPALVLAVVEVESNFNPLARSNKRAQGLMQLIPATARRFGVRDPWDPHQNLRGGMSYLRWLLDRFEGNLSLALAGYNAGEEAVARYGGIPPYTETRNYVQRIARILGVSAETLGTAPALGTASAQGSAPALGTAASRPAVPAAAREPLDRAEWERRFFALDTPG